MRFLLLVLAFASLSPLNAQTSFLWKEDLDLPFTDSKGARLTGTEVIHLVSHKGFLFAGNSYWNETDEARRGQVWVKKASAGSWELDYQMPSGHSRVPALFSAIFRFDKKGAPVIPDTILFAGATFDYGKGSGPAVVFMRDDRAQTWVKKNLGVTDHPFSYTQIRSMGTYHDPITNADLVFAGANPAPTGVYAGRYDPSQPGKILWDSVPELTPSGYQRIMGFAECNGDLFLATQRELYRRNNGFNPGWTKVLDLGTAEIISSYGQNIDPYWLADEDIRGIRAIPNPGGDGQVLIFGALNRIFRVNPAQHFALEEEQNLLQLMNAATEKTFHYIQTQINFDFQAPGAKETIQLIGLEAFYDTAFLKSNPQPNISGFASQGYYFERKAIGSQITYELAEILDYSVPNQPDSLARVRTFALSPFPQDSGKVVYAGGFAPWSAKVTNTAWIYKGTAQPASNTGYTEYRSIPYSQIQGVNPNLLSLDLYVPHGGAAKKPVVIYVHGGSWRVGDKKNTLDKDEFFTVQDYIFVSLNYRLSPDPIDTAFADRIKFPIHPQDVAQGIAWVYQNIGKYGGDTSRIGLIGHSAGAHLAALVSVDPTYLGAHQIDRNSINCTCVLDGGGYDIPYYMNTYILPRNQTSQFLTYVNAFGSDPTVWAAASPALQLTWPGNLPDFLLVHQGTPERIDLSGHFAALLKTAGASAETVNAYPLDHEGINKNLGSNLKALQPYNDTVAHFFERCFQGLTTRVKSQTVPAPIVLYPNPAQDEVFVAFPGLDQKQPLLLTVYSVNGQQEMQIKAFPDAIARIPIASLPTGWHIIKIAAQNQIWAAKFFKVSP